MENKAKVCPICKKSWDRCKCDLEKDLGVKMGSQEEQEWKTILMNTEASIKASKRTIELNQQLIPYIKKRMEEEKEKFSKNQKA